MDDPLVGPKELAATLGLSVRQIRQLRDDEVIVMEGKRYPLHASVQAYIKSRLASAGRGGGQDRFTEIRTKALELDLEERRGNVVQRAAISGACETLSLEAGAVISGIPHSVAHELVGKTDPIEIARILEAALAGARAKIAELRLVVPAVQGDRAGHRALNGH